MYILKSLKTKKIKDDLTITAPREFALLVRDLIGDDLELVENFVVVTLTNASKVIRAEVLYRGTLGQSIVHPRDVFRDAIKENAAAVLIAHNHPSGTREPSRADIQITERLKEVGKLIGIQLSDHLIVTPKGYFYSFNSEGVL